MQIITKGKVVIKFVGLLLTCTDCNGTVRLDENDRPWVIRNTGSTGGFHERLCHTTYGIACPTKTCRNTIKFEI